MTSGRAGHRKQEAAPRSPALATVRAWFGRRSQLVDEQLVDNPISLRGLTWIAYLAAMYYLLSNPLVFIAAIEVSILFASWLTLLMVLIELRRLKRPVVPWSVAGFLIFAALSMAWSISKDDTWTTTRLSVVLAAFALLAAANVSAKIVAYGMALGGAVILAMSFVAHWAQLPGADVPLGTIGTIAGVGTNRNILAYCLVPALGAAVSIRPKVRWEWPLVVVLVLVNAWGIKVAASGTGYLSAAIVVVVVLSCQVAILARRWTGRRALVGMLVVVVSGLVAMVTKYDELAAWVGRDSNTLSGRRPLWDSILSASQDQLFVGYGWGAVWQHPWHLADANPVLAAIHLQAGYPYPHGHNSAMDLLPELGLVGVLLLALIFGQALVRAARLLWTSTARDKLETATLVVAICVAHLLGGLTEPLAITPFGWYVLVLVVGVAARARLPGRAPRPVDVGDAALSTSTHDRAT